MEMNVERGVALCSTTSCKLMESGWQFSKKSKADVVEISKFRLIYRLKLFISESGECGSPFSPGLFRDSRTGTQRKKNRRIQCPEFPGHISHSRSRLIGITCNHNFYNKVINFTTQIYIYASPKRNPIPCHLNGCLSVRDSVESTPESVPMRPRRSQFRVSKNANF